MNLPIDWCRVTGLLLIILAFACAYQKGSDFSENLLFSTDRRISQPESAAYFKSRFVSKGETRVVHAASVVDLGKGWLRAFWFAGSREGAKDVVIRSSVFDPGLQLWSNPVTILSRDSVQTDTHRYIKKLGNPVAFRDRQGKLWLFFVSVSIGGWSCSAINVTTSEDDGITWNPVRRLITSPFLNISTLVKTAPFLYQNGTIGLPVYHELFAKYGEILHLDREGKVVGKQRINSRYRSLQPLILVNGPRSAMALMRYSGKLRPRLAVQAWTNDTGNSWTPASRSSLPNPDAAIAGLRISAERMLVAANNNELLRDDLTLLMSEDQGLSWSEIYRLEDEQKTRGYTFSGQEFKSGLQRLFSKTDPLFHLGEENLSAVESVMCSGHPCWYQFDYPYLIRNREGVYHLLYTWNQTYIKHVEFNQAWLMEKSKGAME